MALQREDQRHVDRDPRGYRVLDGLQAGPRGRDLDEDVRAVDPLVEPPGLLDRLLRLVGEVRVDLQRDPAVAAVAVVPYRPQHVACVLDVGHGELEEDLLVVLLAVHHLAHLPVVRVAGSERLLEDRRVARDPDDRVIADQPLELPALDHLAREGVDPDALAELGQFV